MEDTSLFLCIQKNQSIKKSNKESQVIAAQRSQWNQNYTAGAKPHSFRMMSIVVAVEARLRAKKWHGCKPRS